MSWIWLNFPLAVVMVAFTVGLPLWLIVKHPDGESSSDSPAQVSPRERDSGAILDGAVYAQGARNSTRDAA